MTSDELNESFRYWLMSARARAHREPKIRWFAQDVVAGSVWLNSDDPEVTKTRGRAMAAYFLDPLGYRADADLRFIANRRGISRAQIRRGLKAARS
jgi:hypothetical protein